MLQSEIDHINIGGKEKLAADEVSFLPLTSLLIILASLNFSAQKKLFFSFVYIFYFFFFCDYKWIIVFVCSLIFPLLFWMSVFFYKILKVFIHLWKFNVATKIQICSHRCLSDGHFTSIRWSNFYPPYFIFLAKCCYKVLLIWRGFRNCR